MAENLNLALFQVKAYILEEPKRADMGIFLTRDEEEFAWQYGKGWRKRLPLCKTVGCIAGTAVLLDRTAKGKPIAGPQDWSKRACGARADVERRPSANSSLRNRPMQSLSSTPGPSLRQEHSSALPDYLSRSLAMGLRGPLRSHEWVLRGLRSHEPASLDSIGAAVLGVGREIVERNQHGKL